MSIKPTPLARCCNHHTCIGSSVIIIYSHTGACGKPHGRHLSHNEDRVFLIIINPYRRRKRKRKAQSVAVIMIGKTRRKRPSWCVVVESDLSLFALFLYDSRQQWPTWSALQSLTHSFIFHVMTDESNVVVGERKWHPDRLRPLAETLHIEPQQLVHILTFPSPRRGLLVVESGWTHHQQQRSR